MTQLNTLSCGLATLLVLSGCATTPYRRVGLGALAGGVTAGASATVLSPNSESRGLNALVFGLSGALIGGAIGLWTTPQSEVPKSGYRMKDSIESQNGSIEQFPTAPPTELPEFLKKRFKPAVIESYVEPDSVNEDGSLHEPHRVYRIKQPSELISKPAGATPATKEGGHS